MTKVDGYGFLLTNDEMRWMKTIFLIFRNNDYLIDYINQRKRAASFFREVCNTVNIFARTTRHKISDSSEGYEMMMVDGVNVAVHRLNYYRALYPDMNNRDLLAFMKTRLDQGFVIHHIDRNKSNNSIFNLYEVHKDYHASLHSHAYRDPVKQFELVKKTVATIEGARLLNRK